MSSVAAPTTPASALLDPEAHRLVEEQRGRRLRRLAGRERASLVASSVSFLVVAAVLAALLPSHRSPTAAAVLLLVALYAAAFHFEFEVATGSTVPTQLILVPMLFMLPAGFVPLAVAAGIVLGGLVSYARGELRLGRVFVRLVNCWHAVGPALVIGLSSEHGPSLRLWPLYLAALAAQFAFDFVSAAAREWFVLGVPPRIQMRAMASVYAIDAGLAPVGLAVAFASENSAAGVLLALPLIALLGVFAHDRRARIDHELELRDAYRGTAFLLGDVVEADDAYTGHHSRDVVALTLAVAERLGLSARERRDAEFAALLHDVGKIRIPNEIINKAGPLTPDERALIETHTLEGERMLHRVGGLLGATGRIVRSCHEHYDGSGYPDGLAGEDIPLLARIVACCDAFNAMTSDRSYRRALPLPDAVVELRRVSGTQFDPRVADALIAVVEGAPVATSSVA